MQQSIMDRWKSANRPFWILVLIAGLTTLALVVVALAVFVVRPQAALGQARELAQQGDYARAETAYLAIREGQLGARAAAQAERELLALYLTWAQESLASGDMFRAEKILLPLLDGPSAHEAQALYLQSGLQSAAVEANQNRWVAALETLQRTREIIGPHASLDHATADVLLAWGQSQIDAQAYESGLAHILELITSYPGTEAARQAQMLLPGWYARQGDRALQTGDLELARQSYEEALLRAPDAAAELPWIEQLTGLYREAQVDLADTPVYARDDLVALLHAAWGQHAERAGDFGDAITHYELALASGPGNAAARITPLDEVYYAWAEASRMNEDYAAQIGALETLLEAYGETEAAASAGTALPQAYFNLGEQIMATLVDAEDRVLAAREAERAFLHAQELGSDAPGLAGWINDLQFLRFFDETPGQIVILRPGQTTQLDITMDLPETIEMGVWESLTFSYTFRGTLYPELTEVKGSYALNAETGNREYRQVTFTAQLAPKRTTPPGFHESTIIFYLFRVNDQFQGREVTLHYTLIVWVI